MEKLRIQSFNESEEKSTSDLQKEDCASDCSSISYVGRVDNVFSSMPRHSRNTNECFVKSSCMVPSRLTREVICLPSSRASTVTSSFQGSCFTIFDAQPTAKLENVPATVNCPSRSIQVLTCLEYRASNANWALAGLLCAFGCHFGCCLVPFFLTSVKDVVHICPICKTQLGKYCKE